MKRHVILWFLLSVVTSVSFAQNIKNEKLDVRYLQLPLKPLPKDIKTYRRTIDLVGLTLEDSREQITRLIASQSVLHGYQEVQSGADVEVYIRLEPFSAEKFQVTSEQRTETKSDKTTVKYTVYSGSCLIKYPLYFRLRHVKEDRTIFEGYINNSNEYTTVNSSEFRTYESARTELNSIIQKKKSSEFDNNTSTLNTHIINNYSYYPTTMRWSINYVESSKKANYDDVVAAKDSTMAALKSLTDKSAEIHENDKQRVLAAINLWKQILTESNPNDRKARIDKKVTVAITENIAFCNYFIGHYSAALKSAQEAKEIDKQQWQYDLNQSIEEMKLRMSANNKLYN
jgi:hypothetical protein